jgi:hypothetical protein
MSLERMCIQGVPIPGAIPASSEFLLAWACMPGYKAYRHPEKGKQISKWIFYLAQLVTCARSRPVSFSSCIKSDRYANFPCLWIPCPRAKSFLLAYGGLQSVFSLLFRTRIVGFRTLPTAQPALYRHPLPWPWTNEILLTSWCYLH